MFHVTVSHLKVCIRIRLLKKTKCTNRCTSHQLKNQSLKKIDNVVVTWGPYVIQVQAVSAIHLERDKCNDCTTECRNFIAEYIFCHCKEMPIWKFI